MRAYFGMLAHYITDDWKLRTELLSIEELEGSHTGENQAAHMYKVLTRFGILKKVCHLQFFFVLDSADYYQAWDLHRRQCFSQ